MGHLATHKPKDFHLTCPVAGCRHKVRFIKSVQNHVQSTHKSPYLADELEQLQRDWVKRPIANGMFKDSSDKNVWLMVRKLHPRLLSLVRVTRGGPRSPIDHAFLRKSRTAELKSATATLEAPVRKFAPELKTLPEAGETERMF